MWRLILSPRIWSPSNVWGFQSLHILTNNCYFPFFKKKILAILVNVKSYLIVVLIYISLVTNDDVYLSIGLLDICIHSLEMCPFECLPDFLIGPFLLLLSLLSCKNFYTFLIVDPYQIHHLHSFSCLFIVLLCPLMHKNCIFVFF